MTPRANIPALCLLGLQGLDVIVHVATDQIEAIRVMSNLILGGVAVPGVMGLRSLRRSVPIGAAAYLILNLVFLAHDGVFNPSNGNLRVPLFGFVIGSLVCAAWLWRRAPQ